MISVFTQALVWASLYYFTFEMAFIRAALESVNPQVFLVMAKRLNRMKYILMAVLLTTCLITVYIIYLQKWSPETLKDNPTFFKVIIYSIKFFKLLADLYMY